jgi:imidazole glycerol phosphate synthase glutamine amidotransferase subunit
MRLTKILDLKIGSVNSLFSALKKAGFTCVDIIEDLETLNYDDLLVIPGNGNFGKAISTIDKLSMRQKIIEFGSRKGKLLGICLGMQILGKGSGESPSAHGLGFYDCIATKFDTNLVKRVPHLGWNSVTGNLKTDFTTFSETNDFYFNHSYCFNIEDDNYQNLKTKYLNTEFVSGFISKNIIGVQFHPEKSSKAGNSFFREVLLWSDVQI